MDGWHGWRVALVIAVWVTIAGGLVLGALWTAFGGLSAAGPEDEQLAASGVEPEGPVRRVTSFSSPQVGVHGLLGVLTGALVTYGATRHEVGGHIALLVALAITAVPGAVMFAKWQRGDRPRLAVDTAGQPRVEDRLPKVLVYFHGLGTLVTAALVAVLLVGDLG